MTTYFIKDQDFKEFVTKMVQSHPVFGPVAKKGKFVFDKLNKADELRLDYDVTLLPPKKFFFPPVQNLVKFDSNNYEGCINPQFKILLGVHFYDIKAIDMTDYLFKEKNEDRNYLANRQATTIVGSNIQNVAKRAFWSSVGQDISPKGHDAFLTRTKGGYVFEVLTDKGKDLLKHGKFTEASGDQVKEAKAVNNEMMTKCPEKLNGVSSKIAEKVRKSFADKTIWEECAENCFSCGSCNIVCPTCYCFDVQDNWNVDQKSGDRSRYWDACLTKEFAMVSLGAGATENFRDTRAERFRHRIMRKAAYLNEKLGGPACVGCGRCSSACTSDIADPVKVINRIMEA
jgi:sulfhydrogenase subunit beta (sulfur reductase)